jgi:hypothetical protein
MCSPMQPSKGGGSFLVVEPIIEQEKSIPFYFVIYFTFVSMQTRSALCIMVKTHIMSQCDQETLSHVIYETKYKFMLDIHAVCVSLIQYGVM